MMKLKVKVLGQDENETGVVLNIFISDDRVSFRAAPDKGAPNETQSLAVIAQMVTTAASHRQVYDATARHMPNGTKADDAISFFTRRS